MYTLCMEKWLSNLFRTYFVIYFPLIVVFTASLYVPSDSDLGWHLKYGEYFFKNHTILRENISSTMMPGYKWINSSWATDLVTYATFSRFGFFGLSVLGALIISATLYFFAEAVKLTFWQKAFIFPLILYFEEPLFEVSFRGQLLTLFFAGILYFLFSCFEEKKRSRLFLAVPLFFLWSNFHGQFILGLGLFLLLIGFHLFQNVYYAKWKVTNILLINGLFLLGIFFLSLLATLINPFGLSVYQESLRHFGNPLQRFIIEWIPFEKFSSLWWNLAIWTILLFISFLLLLRQRKFIEKIPYVMPALFLCLLSFYVRRYMWSMLLISIPIVQVIFSALKPFFGKIAKTIAGTLLVIVYLYIIFIKAPPENITNMDWSRFCYQFVGCSPKSAEFLKGQKFSGSLLTFYNWGGWLIWNYPEIKPSIDGRMHLWRDEEGYSAFAEYYPYEQNWKDIDKSKYDIVYMTPKKPIFKRLMELVKENKWKIAYQDEFAYVFLRK